MSILKVTDLHKSFGKHKVLKGVSFSIDEPVTLALVGPKGSGKSTLMNIMMNLLGSDAGEIEILGMKNTDVNLFKKVSFLKDNTVLYPYLSGADHLNYAAKCYGLPRERVEEITEEPGITSYMNKRTGAYSLGMKQHLLLALALLNDPDLFILDEPLTGLDPTSVLKVRRLLQDLGKRGKTILLSSHTLSEVDKVTKEILFLKEGQVFRESLVDENSEERYIKIYGEEER